MPSLLVTVLERTSRGEATFEDLATVLATHDDLFAIFVAPPMDEIRAAAQGPGTRAPKMQLDGVMTADRRFAARLFSDDDVAAAYGRSHGLADAEGGVPITNLSPLNALRQCLTHGWAGLILDDGTDHTVNLEPPPVKTLYITLEALARLPQLRRRWPSSMTCTCPSIHAPTTG